MLRPEAAAAAFPPSARSREHSRQSRSQAGCSPRSKSGGIAPHLRACGAQLRRHKSLRPFVQREASSFFQFYNTGNISVLSMPSKHIKVGSRVFAIQLPTLLPYATSSPLFCPGKQPRAGTTPVHQQPSGLHVSWRATRKPRLLLRFSGLLLLRLATRQFSALLFQLPPRFTRLEPYGMAPFKREVTFFLNAKLSAWLVKATKGRPRRWHAASVHLSSW